MFVRQSGVSGAGEGLWAKCDIPAGQVCALFNGVRLHRCRVIIKLLKYETKNVDKYDEWKLCRQLSNNFILPFKTGYIQISIRWRIIVNIR